MSTQLIDLESGSTLTGDSGERTDVDAIKPIDAGERVQAAVIDRPFENLRARTEELRSKVEELLYRADADKWIITGGNTIGEVTVPGAAAFPTVTWNATTGLCTVSEAIVVQPFVSPSIDLFGYIDWVFTEPGAPFGTVTFRFEANDDPLAGTILYDYQLANSIRVYWESSSSLGAGVFCQATLEGSPVHMLKIVVRDDGTTTAGHVQDALNLILAPVVPDSILKFTLTGLTTTFVVWVETPGRPNEYMLNTYSREMHRMTKTVFDGFFVGSPLLTDGDGIGIWYEELTDSDTTQHGGRRQATPSTIEDISGLAPNTVVPITKLFKFSTEPEKIPGCIPLCRRIGTYLVFIDGTVVEHAHTATLGGEGSIDDLLARYNAHVGGTAEQHTAADILFDDTNMSADWSLNPTDTQEAVDLVVGALSAVAGTTGASRIGNAAYSWVTSTNVGAVIEEIVDDLAEVGAGVSGASRVGNEAIDTGSTHSETSVAGDLHGQIDDLAGWVGDRAHKTAAELITGNWQRSVSAVNRDYTQNIDISTRLDLSCHGGAWGPGVTFSDIARKSIPVGSNKSWGNPKSGCNDFTSIPQAYPVIGQCVCNIPFSSPFLPESGMLSRVIVSLTAHATTPRIYVTDPLNQYTISVNLAGNLPAGTWTGTAICALTDTRIAAMFTDGTDHIVQAWDVTDGITISFSVVAGWGTGVTLPGTGTSTWETDEIISSSSGESLYTLNGWDASSLGHLISKVDVATATVVSSGIGDCHSSGTTYPKKGLTRDTSYLYFTVYNSAGTTSSLCSASLTNLAVGAGGVLPASIGFAANMTCCSLAYDGIYVYAPLRTPAAGTTAFIIYDTGDREIATVLDANFGGATGFLSGELKFCCFDGVNLWIQEITSTKLILWAIDVGSIDITGVTDWHLLGARPQHVLRYSEVNTESGVTYANLGPMVHDGSSIFTCLESVATSTLSGTLKRITRSCYR